MNVRARIPAELRQEALAVISKLSQAEVLAPCLTQRINKAGNTMLDSIILTALMNNAVRMIESNIVLDSIILTALMNNEGNMYGNLTTERVSVAGSVLAGQDAG